MCCGDSRKTLSACSHNITDFTSYLKSRWINNLRGRPDVLIQEMSAVRLLSDEHNASAVVLMLVMEPADKSP